MRKYTLGKHLVLLAALLSSLPGLADPPVGQWSVVTKQYNSIPKVGGANAFSYIGNATNITSSTSTQVDFSISGSPCSISFHSILPWNSDDDAAKNAALLKEGMTIMPGKYELQIPPGDHKKVDWDAVRVQKSGEGSSMSMEDFLASVTSYKYSLEKIKQDAVDAEQTKKDKQEREREWSTGQYGDNTMEKMWDRIRGNGVYTNEPFSDRIRGKSDDARKNSQPNTTIDAKPATATGGQAPSTSSVTHATGATDNSSSIRN